MSEKVKVSREVANAIESALETYQEKDEIKELTYSKILKHCVTGSWGFERKILNKLDVLEVAKILINGYEIEETPEEKLLAEYKTGYSSANYEMGYRDGIEAALMHLGIKIKGIND